MNILDPKHSALKVQQGSPTTAGLWGLASNEQARRVSDWRRQKIMGDGRTEGHQQQRWRVQAADSHTSDADKITTLHLFENSQLEGLYVGDLYSESQGSTRILPRLSLQSGLLVNKHVVFKLEREFFNMFVFS